jgi:hypothetical protein
LDEPGCQKTAKKLFAQIALLEGAGYKGGF